MGLFDGFKKRKKDYKEVAVDNTKLSERDMLINKIGSDKIQYICDMYMIKKDNLSIGFLTKLASSEEIINFLTQNFLTSESVQKMNNNNFSLNDALNNFQYDILRFPVLFKDDEKNKILLLNKEIIEKLNNDKTINGILLQSPIPSNLDINEAFRTISPQKDVDGFNPINVGKLVLNQDTFVSCTPYGIMKMFEEYDIDLTGKNVVILGRSNIVGKPLIHCCLNKNATVTSCHSKTQNIAQKVKEADVLISAIGKANFVTADMVKDGAVVIDVGINRGEDGKLYGDVDFENVEKKASYITPVPGGVGPMTIAMLMKNCVESKKLFGE